MRLKFDTRWLILNLSALAIMIFVVIYSDPNYSATDKPDPVLESGKWAVRFLLLCLAMTPLNTLFGWRYALKLRKSAGLWAFGFGALHFIMLFIHDQNALLNSWLTLPMETFIVFGLLGLVILTVLAITSNRRAQRWLGKNWKRLHRLVYIAGIAIIVHAILASSMSKKMFVRDPLASYELKLYLAILIILLVLRVPPVRNLIAQLKQLRLSSRAVQSRN